MKIITLLKFGHTTPASEYEYDSASSAKSSPRRYPPALGPYNSLSPTNQHLSSSGKRFNENSISKTQLRVFQNKESLQDEHQKQIKV